MTGLDRTRRPRKPERSGSCCPASHMQEMRATTEQSYSYLLSSTVMAMAWLRLQPSL
jgi:hypothetical protein